MENTEKLEELSRIPQPSLEVQAEIRRISSLEKKEQLDFQKKQFDVNLDQRKKETKQTAYSQSMQQLIKQYDGKLAEYTVNSKLEKPDITLLPPIAPTHEDILALAIKIEDYVNS